MEKVDDRRWWEPDLTPYLIVAIATFLWVHLATCR